MITLRDLTLERGVKPLLSGASLTIHPGEKIGLIGSNGSGKSSLFAALLDQLHPHRGDIEIPAKWVIAHVAQDAGASSRNAVDHVIDGDKVLRGLQAELLAAEEGNDGTRIADLHTRLADCDAYTATARAQTLLLGLGFAQADLERPVQEFSGGWRMRLNLAQALMSRSDLLLLDEPTNHLDLDAILWLERWLGSYPGTLLVISHDRDFLDNVVKAIVHIDALKLVRYTGTYTSFETQRAERLTLAQGAYDKQQRQVAHLRSFIDRFKAKATKAKQAQSRVKALEKMELLAPVRAAAEFSFEFREPAAAPDPLMVAEGVSAGYRSDGVERTVLSGVDFTLPQGKRIGLLGVNGAGKSTFIKTLARTLAPLHGDVQLGKGLAIGYFAQHQVETLRLDDSPLQHLVRLAPNTREQELRDFLGSFNFRGDMATSAIRPFSGGEKARLALALLVWQKPNLLLLDEPTNHLDLEAREALTYALSQFEGSLLLVSHDRHLLRATTDEFWLVADGGLRPFDGDLDAYADWSMEQRGAAAGTGASAKNAGGNRREERKLEAQERQRMAQLKKPVQARIDRLEKLMERHTAEKSRLDALLADAAIYSEERKEDLKQATFEHARLCKELATLEEEWLERQDELEQLDVAAGADCA
jgi:ATP-binding cassette subfamily F protein 3